MRADNLDKRMRFEMTKENKTEHCGSGACAFDCRRYGLVTCNAEVVASLGNVGLDADAVMRLLDQTDGSAAVLSEEQQRDLIFKNLLRKWRSKQKRQGCQISRKLQRKLGCSRKRRNSTRTYAIWYRKPLDLSGGWTVRKSRAVPTTRFCIRKSNAPDSSLPWQRL